jgi:nitrogen fixation protein NifU and related proteins
MGAAQLNATESAGYSATTVEHFRQPRNVGRLDDANALGVVDDTRTENFISIYLRVEDGRIAAVTFRTFGCSACIAASSMATVLASGKELVKARKIDARRLLAALDGLPDGKRHCADLAARALAAALDDYAQKDETRRRSDPFGHPGTGNGQAPP